MSNPQIRVTLFWLKTNCRTNLVGFRGPPKFLTWQKINTKILRHLTTKGKIVSCLLKPLFYFLGPNFVNNFLRHIRFQKYLKDSNNRLNIIIRNEDKCIMVCFVALHLTKNNRPTDLTLFKFVCPQRVGTNLFSLSSFFTVH